MSYIKIWVHTVWGTKYNQPILTKEVRTTLYDHIIENAKDKKIFIDKINGYLDHVHCLLALNAEMSISKTMQLIKGEASFWTNNVKLVRPKLEWADEYFAVSVSESMLEKVRNYIRN